jgi:hypothetical protein
MLSVRMTESRSDSNQVTPENETGVVTSTLQLSSKSLMWIEQKLESHIRRINQKRLFDMLVSTTQSQP